METLSDTALKLILAKAREQPIPELDAIEIDLATGQVRVAAVLVLN
jgi:hypothetical protein